MAWMLAVEEVINRALRLDPAASGRLAGLAGRAVGVDVRGLPLRFQVFMAGDGIHLAPWRADGTAPDTGVTGPPLALLRLVTDSEPYQTLFRRGEVVVTGDTGLLERLRAILGAVDIDWEEPLTRVLGDPLGHQLTRGIRGMGRWSRESGESVALDARDFLEEEARLVARRDEVRAFSAAVEALRDQVARLEARVARLAPAPGRGEDPGS